VKKSLRVITVAAFFITCRQKSESEQRLTNVAKVATTFRKDFLALKSNNLFRIFKGVFACASW
jgi:hypothetical protein